MVSYSKWRNPSRTPEYFAWAAARNRCTNEQHPQYKDYGARGIKMCDRWRDNYDAFYDDMGPKPKGTSLERIDNNQGYDPFNCIWDTPAKQVRNTRRNQQFCAKDKAQTYGLNYSTYRHRIRAGIPLEAPIRPYNRKYEA